MVGWVIVELRFEKLVCLLFRCLFFFCKLLVVLSPSAYRNALLPWSAERLQLRVRQTSRPHPSDIRIQKPPSVVETPS